MREIVATTRSLFVAGGSAGIRFVRFIKNKTVEGRFTLISDVSVPYQYRPFSAPDVCEWFYLKYV
jgi:hypothetical protein